MTDSGPFGLPADLEFVRLLGRGAHGTVVLARQLSLNRLVAVKTIQTVAGRSTVERLRREAKVLSGLDHRHILPVYQLRESPAALCLVMKFEPWGDLGAAMGQLSGSQRVMVLSDLCSALSAAHRAGVVHRDLKPANVLSDEYGRAVLADFGLARLPRATAAYRTAGLTVTGTPLYLAPEQIREPQLESPAIDHYAYGVLAYQLLIGRWPYPDPTWSSVSELHLTGRPAPPREGRPELDASVAEALLGLLHKDPRERARPADLVARLTAVSAQDWDTLLPATSISEPAGMAAGTQTGTATGGGASAFSWSATEEALPVGRPSGSSPATDPEAAQVDAERWVEPPVFRPRRSRTRLIQVALVVVGVVLGVLAYLIWLNR